MPAYFSVSGYCLCSPCVDKVGACLILSVIMLIFAITREISTARSSLHARHAMARANDFILNTASYADSHA